MTREETIGILALLKANYSGTFKNMTKEEAEGKINLWAMMLSDVSKEDLLLVVQKIIATNKFFPTIAEIREGLGELRQERIPDAGAAWGEVVSGIRRYGYSREQEAMESFSETTRLAVKRMGWQSLCQSEDHMADRAHFLRIYQAIENRQKERVCLPQGLQDRMEQKRLVYQQQREALAEKVKPLLTVTEKEPKTEKDFVDVGALFTEKLAELRALQNT